MKRAGPATGAASALVLLHGRGGSAADILGLVDRAGLTRTAAIAPEAPGNSWWPTSFLAPMGQMAPHLDAGLGTVAAAVATLQAEGMARDRIWLAGFSQGACLALEAFARQGQGLAGVLAFSGGLVGTSDDPGGDGLYGHGAKRLDYPGDLTGGKAWISVHERDPHIPLARALDSARALTGMGAAVKSRTYPGAGHAVMRDDLATLRAWVNQGA